MVVLLTGATGLIGREVGKLLARRGYKIHALSRNPERARAALPFPCETFAWDGLNEPSAAALAGVEAVIHLAGEPLAEGRWTPEKKQKIRNSRIDATEKLVAAFSALEPDQYRLRVFVQGAAIGIYGDAGDRVLNEESPAGDDFLAKLCVDWEKASKFGDKGQLQHAPPRSVIIRTGIVLAQDGGAMQKMLPPFRAGVGGPLGSGRQYMSWIHLTDIAKLFVFALENESLQGVFNGTAPEPVTNLQFSKALASQLGPQLFLPVPKTVLKIALGEMSAAVLASQRVLPQRALAAGFEFEFPKLDVALSNLVGPLRSGTRAAVYEQWVPRPLEEVFRFFSDEKNLETLTPPFLNFRVLQKSTPEMGSGTVIDYQLSLHGVPMRWQSRIDDWKPGRSFVDTQLRGPYDYWHHTHEFEAMGSGTLIRDRILYRVPLGVVGRAVAGAYVASDVGRIFKFRTQKIGELFGKRIEAT